MQVFGVLNNGLPALRDTIALAPLVPRQTENESTSNRRAQRVRTGAKWRGTYSDTDWGLVLGGEEEEVPLPVEEAIYVLPKRAHLRRLAQAHFTTADTGHPSTNSA